MSLSLNGRARPFNFTPPMDWHRRVQAVKSKKCPLNLEVRNGPISFRVKDEKSSRSFRVSLGNPHNCSCGGEFCEHLLYALIVVLGVPPDNQY